MKHPLHFVSCMLSMTYWLFNFAARVLFNFVLSKLLMIKIEDFKSNYILYIRVQFFVMYLSKFLIFVINELLDVKIKVPKFN